jgi:outer membrane immunogenic protein
MPARRAPHPFKFEAKATIFRRVLRASPDGSCVMSRLRSIAAALGLAAGLAAPVAAADAPGPEFGAASRVAAAWQGFHVGVHAGYSWARYDGRLSPGAVGLEIEASSVSGGLFAGYDFQVAPQFVVGVEADATLWDPTGTSATVAGVYRGESDWSGSLRLRAGMTFDRLMLYATGGLAIAEVDYAGPLGRTSRLQFGYALGAGVEARVTEQVFLRAEYIFTHIGEDEFALGPAQRISGDFSAHTVRLGVGVRF